MKLITMACCREGALHNELDDQNPFKPLDSNQVSVLSASVVSYVKLV